MKRKFICLLLALTLFRSIGISAIAADATTVVPTYDQYLADYYLKFFPYEFYTKEFHMSYRANVETKENDPVYQSLLTSWKIATFELSDVLDSSTKEVAFYEALLFDLMYKGVTTDSLSETLENTCKSVNASVCKKVVKLGDGILDTKLDSLTGDTYTSFMNTLQTCDELKDVFGSISNITEVLGYASDVEDLIMKLCKLQVVRKMSNETAQLLRDILSQTSTSNTSMRTALSNMITFTSESLTSEQVNWILSGKEGVEFVAKQILDEVWNTLLEQFKLYGIAVKAGQAVGKLGSNWLFSTEKDIELYYNMRALYHFEDSLKTVLSRYESTYTGNKTDKNAKQFNTGVDMLMRVHQLAIEYSKQYADLLYKDGVVNSIAFWFRESKYNEYMSDLNSIERSVNGTISFAETSVYNLYLEEYFSENEPGFVCPAEPVTPIIEPEEAEIMLIDLQEASTRWSNIIIDKDTTLTKDIDTYGNLIINANLDLAGHTVRVDGDVLHKCGSLTLNRGFLTVEGDYRMQDLTIDSSGQSSYSRGSGYLTMQYPEDLVHVSGGMYIDSTGWTWTLEDGTLEIAGDFTHVYGEFPSLNNHTVSLVGANPHKIHFTYDPEAWIQNLKISSESNHITWDGYMRVENLQSDATIESNELIIYRLNLNGHDLSINGDATIGTYESVDCKNGSLTISGNILHKSGPVILNRGSLIIEGDYRIQDLTIDSSGQSSYSRGSGYLTMQYPEDLVHVSGGMYIDSTGWRWTLEDGTLEIAGDFTHNCGSFSPNGEHITILNGTEDIQHITFNSSYKFNILVLTRDRDNYVFNPDQCWNELRTGSTTEVSVQNFIILPNGADAATINAEISCPENMTGKGVRVIVGFYQDNVFTGSLIKDITLKNGMQLQIIGNLPDYDTVRLFLLDAKLLSPISSDVPCISLS